MTGTRLHAIFGLVVQYLKAPRPLPPLGVFAPERFGVCEVGGGRFEQVRLGSFGGLIFPIEIAQALLDAEGRRHALTFVRRALGPGRPREGWMEALVAFCQSDPDTEPPRIEVKPQ